MSLRHLPSARSIASGLDTSHRGSGYSHVSRLATRSTHRLRKAEDFAYTDAMFTKNGTEITSEQVVQELLAHPDSEWHEYRGRGPITKNQVAALLRDLDIRPVVVHPTKRSDFSRHGYRVAQFDDAFARFLPHEPNIRQWRWLWPEEGIWLEAAFTAQKARGKS